MTKISTIAQLDRSSVLHPATQLKEFASGKLGDPTIVTGGKGIRIQDAQGRSYIDGFAGLYCVNVGYGRTEVAEAIAQQAYKLAYYHSFAAHTTEALAILSDRLVRMAPGRPSKVFFGCPARTPTSPRPSWSGITTIFAVNVGRRKSFRDNAAFMAAQ